MKAAIGEIGMKVAMVNGKPPISLVKGGVMMLYIKPQVELVKFDEADIIRTSLYDGNGDGTDITIPQNINEAQ